MVHCYRKHTSYYNDTYLFRGSTVLEGPWPPHIRRLLKLFRHLVGLLGRGISQSQGLYQHRTTQHKNTKTDIHALSGIQSRDPSVRAIKVEAPDYAVTVTNIILVHFM
jgi:hypothetical protein